MHGGAAGSGAPSGNKNSRKHGVYDKALMSHFAEDLESKELYEMSDPAEKLDGEIRLVRYRLARLTKWIAEHENDKKFEFPHKAFAEITDLLRRLIKDKNEMERMSHESNPGDRDPKERESITKAMDALTADRAGAYTADQLPDKICGGTGGATVIQNGTGKAETGESSA